jgi:hypothetical protein
MPANGYISTLIGVGVHVHREDCFTPSARLPNQTLDIAKASIASPGSPTVAPCSSATRPRPSASTAALAPERGPTGHRHSIGPVGIGPVELADCI